MTAIYTANTTGIQEIFKPTSEDFKTVFHCKEFLHQYTREVTDEMAFTKAENINDPLNVRKIITCVKFRNIR
jgi:hypothetical protein